VGNLIGGRLNKAGSVAKVRSENTLTGYISYGILPDPALESEVNMLEWLLKHSGHILKIEVHYDVMKTFWCHCLTCDETESFNYFK